MPRPEQTERATPKRLEESRKKGQLARSTELAGAGIFLGAILALHFFAGSDFGGLGPGTMVALSHIASYGPLTIFSVWGIFAKTLGSVIFVMAMLFAIAFGLGVLLNVVQVGLLFTLQPLKPNFSKLNPLSGFKRIFSKQVAVNLLKQFIKLGAVAIILYSTVAGNLGFFLSLGEMSPYGVFNAVGGLIYDITFKFAVLLVIVGILDYAYERWNFMENQKMTKQEVKDEMRQAEGNPEVRGAVKRRQREFARRRMLSAVPRATVVVTNPTHFAVALEWDEIEMEAPVVVAKGADLVALRIREIAREAGVPILENPPLARTLYEKVALDQMVPPNLYAAVAQVIAFVYRLKRKTIA